MLTRAMDILNALSKHPDGLTLGEIATYINLPRSTVHRLVQTLDKLNLVISASPAGGVRLGPALLSLAMNVKQSSVAEIFHPVLVQLVKDTGETVDMAVFGKDKVVLVDQLRGTLPLLAISGLGSSRLLHSSASGKALLATLPPDELAALKKRIHLVAETKNTITKWSVLEQELDAIRRTGVAYDLEEYAMGVCALATVVHGPFNEVAAIAMPVPKERFHAIKKHLTRVLLSRTRTFMQRG